MSNTTLPKIVTLSDNVLSQQINNEYVLLNMETEQYFGLDEVGARLWELLAENNDTEKAFIQLLTEYSVDETILRQDIALLLAELEKEKLVTT